jgi:pimeloyl-ACP methyl ester carboxylesterase
MIIRPPRNNYQPIPDGTASAIQDREGNAVMRKEVHLKSRTGTKLVGAFLTCPGNAGGRPCVIYMHGNASNKSEGEEYARDLVPLGIDLFCFDFSGCGNSGGDFVTLGWKETEDLLGVLDFLKEQGLTSKVGLWGRSMGAATALMTDESKSPLPIGALVLDSAFSDISVLIKEMAGGMGIPPELAQMLLPMLSAQITQKTGGMDLTKIAPITHCPSWKEAPALFLHGIDDNMINMEHSQRNFDAYACANKETVFVNGDHNSARPDDTNKQVFAFFGKSLK